MKRYEFWCTSCPTRIVIEHDSGDVEFWHGNAYPVCSVCGESLVDPADLIKRGITRYDGSVFKIRAKTPAEHARLNAIGPEDDRQRERDRWERQGRERGFLR